MFSRILWLSILNLVSLGFLLSWCHSTRSLGLRSITYLVFFDTLSLCICALRIWVEQKKSNQQYTFGYERFEVLAIFLSTTFSFVSALFLFKKSIERLIYPLPLPVEHFSSGIILSFLCHMIVTYCMKNKGLNLVVCATNSMFLPQHIMDFSQNFRNSITGINTKMTPRFNPFSIIGIANCVVLVISQLIIDMYDCQVADCIASILNCFMMSILMFPLSAYSAKILLQGTPPHIADLLDKCLREASTLDGVLEFRNEHFWLLGYDKIVGSVHVRIRRDANEQSVLSHLMSKLSSLVSDLTIQVFKDEWTWSSSTMQVLNESFKKFPPMSAYTPPVSSANKNLLEEYSTPTVAGTYSYNKPLYYTSTSDSSPIYAPYDNTKSHTTTVSLPPIVPRLPSSSSSSSCALDLSNLGTNSTPSPRISRSESDHPRNISINPIHAASTSYTTSYNS